jgi:hypothetical protein
LPAQQVLLQLLLLLLARTVAAAVGHLLEVQQGKLQEASRGCLLTRAPAPA